jgi:hypothetical protein
MLHHDCACTESRLIETRTRRTTRTTAPVGTRSATLAPNTNTASDVLTARYGIGESADNDQGVDENRTQGGSKCESARSADLRQVEHPQGGPARDACDEKRSDNGAPGDGRREPEFSQSPDVALGREVLPNTDGEQQGCLSGQQPTGQLRSGDRVLRRRSRPRPLHVGCGVHRAASSDDGSARAALRMRPRDLRRSIGDGSFPAGLQVNPRGGSRRTTWGRRVGGRRAVRRCRPA